MDRTVIVVLTSQSSIAYHPGVIPRYEAVLRTSGSSGSALTCAQREQIANVGPLVQLGSWKYNYYDPEVLGVFADYTKEEFDSGASCCLSGDTDRIERHAPCLDR